jgi:hypothetical protein
MAGDRQRCSTAFRMVSTEAMRVRTFDRSAPSAARLAAIRDCAAEALCARCR